MIPPPAGRSAKLRDDQRGRCERGRWREFVNLHLVRRVSRPRTGYEQVVG